MVGVTLALGGILVGTGIIGPAGAQSATPIEQCQTIDEGGSYYLATDNLSSTSGSCIEITASGVTFDGNNNVIKDGTYTTTAVSVSADNVAVENLTTKEVGAAVTFSGVSDGRIENIAVEDDSASAGVASTDGTAITVSGGSNNEIRDNSIFDPGDGSGNGIRIVNSTNNLVVNNEITAPFGAGIELYSADDNNISKNVIEGAGAGSRYSDTGIQIGEIGEGASNDNYLFDNRIDGNGFGGSLPELATGIAVRTGTGNELDTNSVRNAAGRAVIVADDRTTLVDNAVNENGENGILVTNVSNTNLTGNTIRGAGREDGSAGLRVQGSGATIAENRIESGDGAGLYITSSATSPDVENNTIQFNDGWAVDVEISVEATRTQLGSDASWVTVSGTGYKFDAGSAPDATLPERRQAVGIYIGVDGADGITEIRTKYRDDTVSTVNESTLRLWQYDGAWQESATHNSVDTDANIVSGGTVSADGTVAPLANNTPPTATLTSASTSLAPNETVTFNASGSTDPDGELVEYRWDFDADGIVEETTTLPTTTHEYTQTGEFDATVTAVDNGDDTDSATRSVSVREQPIATLVVSPAPTSIDANTTLDASNSTFAYGTITEYQWDFTGDGTIDQNTTVPTTNHTYAATGGVSPTVTAVGDDGTNGTASTVLTVRENLPPTETDGNSGLSFACTRGFDTSCTNWVGDEVSFFTQNFEDPDGEIVEYRWDFDGDGTTEAVTASGSASYSFSETGTYDATVTLVDDDGATLATTNDITISERQTGTIAGTVTNASGDPIANTTVIVYRQDIEYNGTTTDANGTYQLTDVAADDTTYNVTVNPVGYAADSQELTVGDNVTETADFQLNATNTTSDTGTLLVIVEDPDGVAIADATVAVRNRNGVITTETTDQNGQTSDISLPAAHHSLTVTKSGYDPTTAVAAISEGETSYVYPVLATTPTAFFNVTIDTTNEPVTEGETLTVDATVENTGSESGTQVISLSTDGTERDAQNVTLNGSETTALSLTWPTAVGDAGPYTATVESANDSDPVPVVVDEESSDSDGGTTETATSEPTTMTTTTSTATTTTSTATTTAGDLSTTTMVETTGSQAPGFGPLTAITAVLAAAVFAIRRRL